MAVKLPGEDQIALEAARKVLQGGVVTTTQAPDWIGSGPKQDAGALENSKNLAKNILNGSLPSPVQGPANPAPSPTVNQAPSPSATPAPSAPTNQAPDWIGSGYTPSDPGARANADALTRAAAPQVAAARDMIASGNVAGGIQQISNAAGISVNQAAENVAALQQGRPAVNTSSPTGLWSGTVGTGNPAGAPTSVIESTATPAQANAAASLARTAAARAMTMMGSGAGAKAGGAVAPSMPAPAAASVQAPTYYNPVANGGDLLNRARARASLLIGTQREQLRNSGKNQRDELARRAAMVRERNRELWASKGLADSGFLAGANSLNDAEAARLTDQQLAGESAQLARLSDLESQSTVANLDDLTRMERDFSLREADLNSLLAQRAFQLQRGQQMLPYELGAAGLGNEQAQFSLGRGQQMLPYELGAAGLANQQAALSVLRGTGMLPYEWDAARLANEGRGTANEAAQFNLDTARQMAPIEMNAAKLANRARELELEIASDPNVGSKAQKQGELDLIRAQIAAQNALSTQRASGGGGFTPWQQHQIESQAQSEQTKVREKAAKSYFDAFNISKPAAEIWVGFKDLASTPKEDGSMPTRDDLRTLLVDLLQSPEVGADDQAWLTLMFESSTGNQTATNALRTNKYRRDGGTQYVDPAAPKSQP